MPTTTYGDISPRTAAYAAADFLVRALPHLVFERFGQSKPIPKNETNAVKFRRFEAIAIDTTALVEGVTPAAVRLTITDVTATLSQFGTHVEITDVIMDTHEDPVLREGTMVLAENAAQTLETVRYNIVKAGTNVRFTNGAARSAVNTVVDRSDIRSVTKTLQRQNAKMFTSILKSTPNYDTHPIEAAYWAVTHPDMESDIRDIVGFVSAAQYGTTPPIENEIGSVEHVRFVKTTLALPFLDAGGAKGDTESTSGVSSDVYPILVFGRDAYGIVPLKGKSSVTPMVVNPGNPSDSDPLGQRGHISWKAYHTAVILNDAFMVRIESAATA